MRYDAVNHGNLNYSDAITVWDEAIPLGNGQMGGLLWGPSQGLRLRLDRGDLWDHTETGMTKSPDFTFSRMEQLVREGNNEEIRRIFCSPYFETTPCKILAGAICLDFGRDLPMTCGLTLQDAQAWANIGTTELRLFFHARKNVGLAALSCPASAFRLTLENPAYGSLEQAGEQARSGSGIDTASLSSLHYPDPVLGREKNLWWFTQQVDAQLTYGVFVKIREQKEQTLLAWTVAATGDGPSWQEDALARLEEALDLGYDRELEAHQTWWNNYWSQSTVEVPDPGFMANYYRTMYLLGAGSRKGSLPIALQGLWTSDNGKLPPWKGDYHHDLNTQMTYYPYLKAGHFEEGESFLDFLWNTRQAARDFARHFYGAPGLCMPSTTSDLGQPLAGWAMYSYAPTNHLWLCQSFERHWRFTGDDAFLRERAYPYLKESADFLLHILRERDGAYYLPLSSSPEIHDDELSAFLTPNSNYDLAIMRWFFGALEEMSRQVGDGLEQQWHSHLEKLPQLALAEDHVYLLSPDERLRESHRHFSHLMAIHPLRLMDYDSPAGKEIIDACLFDLRALGTGFWAGFSLTWAAELYAIAKNGNAASFWLHAYWNTFCGPNGFNLNQDPYGCGITAYSGRTVTLDSNFCAADALQEMLLQTEHGRIKLFPALPGSWKRERVSFHRLRGERGLEISACWHGTLRGLCIRAAKDVTITLDLTEDLRALMPGLQETKPGLAEVSLSAGEILQAGTMED